jgi:hypothetical protein
MRSWTTIHEVKTKYEADQLYTRLKLDTKHGNYTRGQNYIPFRETIHEVKIEYEPRQLYTRPKLNTIQ